MARKLSEDYIKFTLSLSTDEAQQEIHKLKKHTKELKDENKGLQESMRDLVRQGKVESEEYANLKRQFDANSRSISENNAKTRQLISTIDRQHKSYAQLSKEARDLRRQLNNTVKALQPEEYDRLQRELNETTEAMRRLRGETAGSNEKGGLLGGLGKLRAMMLGGFAGIGATVAGALSSSVSGMKQFVAEGMEMATAADGVQHAFDQLNRPDILENLRQATKGTVNDLQLMQAAVKARDFRIPLEDMGKFLAFAQLKAQQTGQSVEYMTESIVTGLGRQSLLILDNLGLSAAEIREEVTKTGDFMKGVSVIVERQLQQAGQYVSAADQVAQADVRLQNAKLRLGQRLSWVGDLWNVAKNKMADYVNWLAVADNAENRYYAQKSEHISLEKEHKERLRDLLSVLQDESAANAQRREAMEAIRKEYPVIFQKYIDEKGHIRDLIGLWQEYNKTKHAESVQHNKDTVSRLEQELEQLAGQLDGANWFNRTRISNRMDDLRKQLKLAREDVRRDELQQWQADLKTRSDEQVQAEIDTMKRLQSIYDSQRKLGKNAPQYFNVRENSTLTGRASIEEIADRSKILQAELDARRQLDEAPRNKSYWEQKKKEAEDARDALDLSKRNSEEWRKYERQIAEAQANIDAYASKHGGASPTGAVVSEAARERARKQAEADARREAERKSKEAADEVHRLRDREAAWDEYLVRFGDFQQQREALVRKYDRQIAEAATAGEAAILNREKLDALDELDNRVKESATLMAQLFADASQKSVRELEAIIDKAELLSKWLQADKSAGGSASIGGKTYSRNDIKGMGVSENTLNKLETDPESLEQFMQGIDKLRGKLGGKSPFLLFKNQVKEAAASFKKGNMAGGVQTLGNAVSVFSADLSDFGHNLGTIFGSDGLGKEIDRVASGIDGLGQTASGVGQIMSGDIVGGSMAAVGGLSKVVGVFDDIFGADYSQYLSLKEEYEGLIDVWNILIDKKREYIQESYGPEVMQVGEEAIGLVEDNIARYRQLLLELGRSGSGLFSHSLGYKIDHKLSREDYKRLSDLAGQTIRNEQDIWQLSAEQLQKVMSDPKLIKVLNDVNKDFVTYLEKIVEGSEQILEIQDSIKTQLTQVSFDALRDNFYETLLDMESDSEMFSDKFASYLQRAIIRTKLAKTLDGELQKWYDRFAETNKDGSIDDKEYDELKKKWESIVQNAVEERDKLKDFFGWESGTGQSGTKGYAASMNQETGEELSGRILSMTESNYRLETGINAMSLSLSALSSTMGMHLECTTEIRDMLQECNDRLAKIEKNTSILPAMNETMEAVENNTKNL